MSSSTTSAVYNYPYDTGLWYAAPEDTSSVRFTVLERSPAELSSESFHKALVQHSEDSGAHSLCARLSSPNEKVVVDALKEALSTKSFSKHEAFNFAFCPSVLDSIVECIRRKLKNIEQQRESGWAETIIEGCLVLIRNTCFELPANQQTLSLHTPCIQTLIRILKSDTFTKFHKLALQVVYLLGDWIDIQGERYAASMLIGVQTEEHIREQLHYAGQQTFERIGRELVDLLLDRFRNKRSQFRNLACRCLAVICEASVSNGPIVGSLATDSDVTKLVELVKDPSCSLMHMPWPSVTGSGLSTLFIASENVAAQHAVSLTEEEFTSTLESRILERVCKSIGDNGGVSISRVEEHLKQSRNFSGETRGAKDADWERYELRDSGLHLAAALIRTVSNALPSLLRPLLFQKLLDAACSAEGPIVSPLHALHALRAACIHVSPSSPEGQYLQRIISEVMYQQQIPDWLKMELRILFELTKLS